MESIAEESTWTTEDEASEMNGRGLFSEMDINDRELLAEVDRIKKDKRYGWFGPNLKLKDFGVKRRSKGSAYPL